MAHAVICGAGPAGALLSFLLARGGVQVTLLERHVDFSREFRGEGLAPSGMAAIRASGLWEDFLRLPATRLRSMEMYADGRSFLRLDLDRVLPGDASFIRVLAQNHLLEMLAGAASAYSTFALRRGALVRDAVVENGRVVGVRYQEGGTDRVIKADYVIAADGRYSTLRRSLGLALAGEQQSFDVVWCKIPRPEAIPSGRVYGILLEEFFGLIFPTERDQLQIGRIIAKGSYRAMRGDDPSDWYDQVLAMLPTALRPILAAEREKASNPVLLDVVSGSMPAWSVPGLLFLGDAAHPMSPIGAQGINTALRDAVEAANHLGPALLADSDGASLDLTARAFEVARRVEVDALQRQQGDALRRLAFARRIAPLWRIAPSGLVEIVARYLLSMKSTQRFISGVPMRLEFTGESPRQPN